MKFRYVAFTIVMTGLFWPMNVEATIINVPADQPTIQAAINAAAPVSGDTILVAPGRYYENITFLGKRIIVSSHFLLDGDPSHIFETIIDGSQPVYPDTASVVRLVNGEDSLTVLQGFTITGGTGTDFPDSRNGLWYREGGGIICEFSNSVIRYNFITDNEAVKKNAGISSSGGGAIRAGEGNPRILNNVITHNRGYYGAGIVLNYSFGIIKNNLIAHNTGGNDYSGSGIWKNGGGGEVLIENNTIINNTSTQTGAGIWLLSTPATVRNNIIWGNTGPAPAQIKLNGGATVNVSYSDVQGGYAGTGNIDQDPLLMGEFAYLNPASPCIDGGDGAAGYNDPADLITPTAARWPARNGLTNDMGMYGGGGSYPFEWISVVADVPAGWAPHTVNFMAGSWLPAYGWAWDFGDTETSNIQNPTHIFQNSGQYDLTLTVDTGGGSAVKSLPEFISALDDSLTGAHVEGMANVSVEVAVSAHNIMPLRTLKIPASYSGPLEITYDSLSTNGCRTDYFEYVAGTTDLSNKNLFVEMTSSLVGTSPDLPPGDGPVVKFYFTIQQYGSSGLETPISLAGWEIFAPEFVSGTFAYTPRLENGSVRILGICGDANSDLLVNVGDAIFLINYAFKGGPAPNPTCKGDTNHDDKVNVGDVVFLINYIFRGTTPPIEPCCP